MAFMIKKLTKCFLAASFIALGFNFGCGSGGGSEIARVGKDEITAEDLAGYIQEQGIGFRSAEEEFTAKRQIVDTLINQKLLVQAAYEMGLDKSPEVEQLVESNRSKFLLDALYDTHIASKVTVSETEILDFYKDLEYQIRAFQIVTAGPDTAEALLERLKQSANFEQLAYEYSIDPSARRNRGDMGYFQRGSSGSPEFDRIVFKMEVGEISPVIGTEVGYHIVKVVDKRPNDTREEFARMRGPIGRQLLSEKRMTLTSSYFDTIMVKYPITVDRDVADYVTLKRQNLYPPPVVAKLPKYDFDDDQLDRDEKELILATWDGGQMSLIDYLFSVRRIFPPEQRPNFDDYDSLAKIIYSIKRPDLLAREAELEKLDQTVVYKRNIKLYREGTMSEILRTDTIQKVEAPTEDEMREYYDQHRDEFLVPRQVHAYEIAVSDEMLAQNLAKSIKTLDDFQVKAAQYTERAGQRVKGGDLGYFERDRNPYLYRVLEGKPTGQVYGPFRGGDGKYSILWPSDWTKSEYKDYLTAKPDIRRVLIEQRKDLAYKNWIAERRANTRVEVDEEAIWETIDREIYGSAAGSAEGRS